MTGVIIRDAQNGNKYIQLNAAKGVILATGDNSGDEKIMKHFAPEIVEKNIANTGSKYQFERIGYFCADKDSSVEKPVFNRTVTLKDSWSKMAAK